MDRQIEPTKGIRKIFTRKALPYWGGALLLVFIGWLLLRDNASRLRTNGDTLTVGEVRRGEFNDYIRISGRVVPMTTVQLSPLEGGVVQQIVSEEGAHVLEGDFILILSNEIYFGFLQLPHIDGVTQTGEMFVDDILHNLLNIELPVPADDGVP
jgi:HlyD family secretion protein